VKAGTFALVVLAMVTGGSAGCMPKMSIEQIKAMQPVRPPQLDRLDMLLGKWETSGEVRMTVLDGVLSTSGSNEATWAMDKRFLVDRADLNMGELGAMTGMSIWTWDPTVRKYRMWWFDSFGETSEATASYNETTRTWHMKARGQKYGHATTGKGTLRQIDENTLEWTWKEYAGLGLIKLADMKGISRRQEAATD